MQTIENAVNAYEGAYGDFPYNSELEIKNDRLVWALDFDKKKNPLGKSFIPNQISLSNSNLLDEWGTPLHVILNRDKSKSESRIIKIWSDGPDRINQFGHGDDKKNWK